MKPNFKSLTALFFIVATVYVLRSGNLSSQPFTKGVFRQLWSYARRTSATCDGVTLESAFSESDLSRAESLQKSLAGVRNGNPLQNLLQTGDIGGHAMDYVTGLIPSIAVWAAFFVISFIVCCCAICNWCCIYGCCKNCKCCRCCKKPQGTKRKRVYQICSLVLLLALFATGIAGAAFSGTISKGIMVSYCSVVHVIEDLTYGVKGGQWLGIGGIKESLGIISTRFGTAVDSLGQASDTSALNTALTNVKTKIDALYNNNNAKTTTRADPAIGGTYQSDYIKNLGPRTTQDTYTYAIATELQAKYDAVTNAKQPVNDAVNTLQGQKSSIQSAINSGQSAAGTVYTAMDGLVTTLNDAGPLITDVVGKIGQAILGIFICYIIIAVLPIISIALIHFLKIKFFSKILHLSWCLMGILTILGFLISAIFYPISVVFTEFCQVFTVSLNDQTYFTNTFGSLLGGSNNKASDMVKTCVFGDGKALQSLGITDQLSSFDTIYAELDKVNAASPLTGSGSVVLATTIELQTWYTGAVKSYLIPDSQNAIDDLKTLNTLASKTTNSPCTNNDDYWIYSDVNCTDSSRRTFLSSSVADYDQPNPTCIGFNAWITSGHTGANRYDINDFPASCAQKNGGAQLTYVQTFVDTFKQNRLDINTNFGTTSTANTVLYDLDQVKSTHDAGFGTLLASTLQPFKDIKTALQNLDDALRGTANGLLPNTNCKFLGTGLRNFSGALCTGFVASLYQATTVLIIVSMFSFFGAIGIFCLAKRVLNTDETKQGNNDQFQY